jgi:hypothetical protein
MVTICTTYFNIPKILHSAHRVYMCVSHGSHKKKSDFSPKQH